MTVNSAAMTVGGAPATVSAAKPLRRWTGRRAKGIYIVALGAGDLKKNGDLKKSSDLKISYKRH